MSRVFVDTWAWYAMADERDADHEVARLASEELIKRESTLVTTNFILDEATTLIRYKLSHSAAVTFRRTIRQLSEDGLLIIIPVGEPHESAAGEIFDRYSDQDFSFTDCTSFAVMRELGITEVFTGDRHFSTMGFTLFP
ncbi:MAG: PIN domain-containing protein [Chloroflexota bacterium]